MDGMLAPAQRWALCPWKWISPQEEGTDKICLFVAYLEGEYEDASLVGRVQAYIEQESYLGRLASAIKNVILCLWDPSYRALHTKYGLSWLQSSGQKLSCLQQELTLPVVQEEFSQMLASSSDVFAGIAVDASRGYNYAVEGFNVFYESIAKELREGTITRDVAREEVQGALDIRPSPLENDQRLKDALSCLSTDYFDQEDIKVVATALVIARLYAQLAKRQRDPDKIGFVLSWLNQSILQGSIPSPSKETLLGIKPFRGTNHLFSLDRQLNITMQEEVFIRNWSITGDVIRKFNCATEEEVGRRCDLGKYRLTINIDSTTREAKMALKLLERNRQYCSFV